MTTTQPQVDEHIPVDRFKVRIAIVRAEMGWNYRQAGDACDLDPESWRLWEKTDRHPQHYEQVCRRIAEASGYSYRWVSAGGPLAEAQSRWCSAHAGQGTLPLTDVAA